MHFVRRPCTCIHRDRGLMDGSRKSCIDSSVDLCVINRGSSLLFDFSQGFWSVCRSIYFHGTYLVQRYLENLLLYSTSRLYIAFPHLAYFRE
jgi:hypothetical protein